ncbi:cytokine receptor-like factor 2 isoform X2 [Alosa pseudoharengus]|uniref:cytokine receptor-like factor 2 isoform X2 n=1 Tax=Alosa pseudoharengus TaxID=34774 RepID=UPI003F89379E
MKAIDVEKIKLSINETGQHLLLSWSNPEPDIRPTCYDTHLQYMSSCHENWTVAYNNKTRNFSLAVTQGRGRYGFKVRMRYGCRGSSWSTWTREKWTIEGNSVPCNMDPPQGTAYYPVLWTLIAVILILLLFLSTQKWIRNYILQNIPDPKHVQQNMLNFSHSAWWENTSLKGECVAIEVEEVVIDQVNQDEKKHKEEEQKAEEEEDDEEEEEERQREKEEEDMVQLLTEEGCGDLRILEGGSPVPALAQPGISYGGTYILWPSQT